MTIGEEFIRKPVIKGREKSICRNYPSLLHCSLIHCYVVTYGCQNASSFYCCSFIEVFRGSTISSQG